MLHKSKAWFTCRSKSICFKTTNLKLDIGRGPLLDVLVEAFFGVVRQLERQLDTEADTRHASRCRSQVDQEGRGSTHVFCVGRRLLLLLMDCGFLLGEING